MEDKNKILAGIVTFNPDLERLEENISAIINQVEKLIIVDNGSNNYGQIDGLSKKYSGLSLISLGENKGIAFALNQIGNYAVEYNYDYFLTLDQDSVVKENLINEYKKYLDLENIGLLNCYMEDRNLNDEELNREVVVKDKLITSGSLMPTKLFSEGFTYDDDLFIDLVDFDLTVRLKKAGYNLYQIPFNGLLHELGDAKYNKIFGKNVVTYNHSPLRRYYYTRNSIILLKKHGINKDSFEYAYVGFVYFMKGLLFEEQKLKKSNAYFKGLFDGLRFKVRK